MMRRFYDKGGMTEINGHLLYALPDGEYATAEAWLERVGLLSLIDETVASWQDGAESSVDAVFDTVESRFVDAWQDEAGLNTYGDAVADLLEFRDREGEPSDMSVAEWREFAERAPLYTAREKARQLGGADVAWDCERVKTPEGYYQVRGGIPYAIAKSLAAAPVRRHPLDGDQDGRPGRRQAVRRRHPRRLPRPDARLQPVAVVQLGHHRHDRRGDARVPGGTRKDGVRLQLHHLRRPSVDGVASEEFATSLRQEGMLALARLQRKMRLVESPYRTPQTLVGGPRSDAALAASSGRTATTKSMGKGSTQHQHLVQTEVPKKLLEEWLALWSEHNQLSEKLTVQLRPRRAGSDVLDLGGIYGDGDEPLANVVVDPIKDRHGRSILTVRDQNTFAEHLRQKRLMDVIHLWLIHRFKAEIVYYVTPPTEDNIYQTEKMKSHGIFSDVYQEVGEIIVADVNKARIEELLAPPDRQALRRLISKQD